MTLSIDRSDGVTAQVSVAEARGEFYGFDILVTDEDIAAFIHDDLIAKGYSI